jgi:hypothetical protein
MPQDQYSTLARTPGFNPNEPDPYSPYGSPTEPTSQISQSPSGGGVRGGIFRGIIGSLQRRRQQAQREEQEARESALRFLDTIPDTEHNMPIKASMALEILGSKAKRGGLLDSIFGNQNATAQYVSDIYGKLKAAIPQEMGFPEGTTRLEGTTPTGETVSARPRRASEPGIPATVATPGPGDLGAELMGPGPAGIPGSLAGTSGDIGLVGPGEITVARPRAPQFAPSTGPQFEFPEQGKYQTLNQTFQDPATGGRYLMMFDQRTGGTKRVDLGPAKTSQEIVEEMRSLTKGELARMAMTRNLTGAVLAAASKDGIPPQAFYQLPMEAQIPYYQRAGVSISETTETGQKLKASQINLNEQKVLESQAKARLYGTMAGAGGLTPGQRLTDERARAEQARGYVGQFRSLMKEAEQARIQLEQLRNPPRGSLLEMQKGIGKAEYLQQLAQLEALYKSRLGEAQRMALDAGRAFPGLLNGTLGGASGVPDIQMSLPEGSSGLLGAPGEGAVPGAGGLMGPVYDATSPATGGASGGPPPASSIPSPPARPRRSLGASEGGQKRSPQPRP